MGEYSEIEELHTCGMSTGMLCVILGQINNKTTTTVSSGAPGKRKSGGRQSFLLKIGFTDDFTLSNIISHGHKINFITF